MSLKFKPIPDGIMMNNLRFRGTEVLMRQGYDIRASSFKEKDFL